MPGSSFDFPAFKAAFEARDVARWPGFHAEAAEWIEHRDQNPPRRPRRFDGQEAIRAFIGRIAEAPITLAIEDEILGGDRMAFRVWVGLPEGRRIVEHIIIHTEGGKIVRQIDVEAWDP